MDSRLERNTTVSDKKAFAACSVTAAEYTDPNCHGKTGADGIAALTQTSPELFCIPAFTETAIPITSAMRGVIPGM